MKRIEGMANISLETLDELRECEALYNSFRRNASGLIARIETEQYEKECKKIDEMNNVSDKTLIRLCEKAAEKLKIIVSDANLRKLIRDFLDGERSDAHYALDNMTDVRFAKIPLILESGQQSKSFRGQQDASVCEMCEMYMTDAECDIKENCPAAGIVKRLKEAEKIIKERDKMIRELKKKLNDSELKRSYMVDPMAIGDRHEMGG